MTNRCYIGCLHIHGYPEMTQLDKPHGSKQRYQLTSKSRRLLANAEGRMT